MVGNNKKQYLVIILAFVLATTAILPFIYMILMSFANSSQVDRVLIPTKYTLDSYRFLISGAGNLGVPKPWFRALFNSFFVSFVRSILTLATSLLIGYAITKLRFKGKTFVHYTIVFQMFFPAVIILIPKFLVTKYLGISGSYFGMIMPTIISGWAMYMYINYFISLPDEVLEAARIDGAKESQIVAYIVLPMTKSITTVLFLFLFMERWGELLWDIIVVKEESRMTLNVLLASLKGPYGGFPGPMYAASVLFTFPIIILFMFFARNFKEGMNHVTK
ncbi:MAG: carbohydrate ABC transporter permease [Bacilli bacterium]